MTSEPELGPAMLACSERERGFVWAYLRNGGNGRQAAIEAGYSDVAEGAKVRAHALMHRDRVLAAIDEVGRQAFRSLLIPAVRAAGKLIENPDHAAHANAVFTTLARLGLGEKTEHKVTVEHTTDDRLMVLAQRFAAELGVDMAKLIGGNSAPKLIEGEAVSRETESEATDGGDR